MNSTKSSKRWWRVTKRILVVLILIAVVLIYGVLPYLLARLVTNASTRPTDRQLTTTPATYGATFEDVEFTTSDGVKISGWLLPSRDRHATIIYSHGLFRSRRELLERAVELWKLGYGALLYDARNHGNSGAARVSLGYYERLDAEAAVQFLREERKSTDRIVLFGISLGAVTALLAAAETPQVDAVISDSAFLSFDDTIAHHIRVFLHLPSFPLAAELGYFIESRADFSGSQVNALEAVKRLGERPVLFIAGRNDKRMPPQIAETLYNASSSPQRDLLIIDGVGSEIHGHAYQANSTLYLERLSRFLTTALPQ